ncbi:MAG: NAD-dependent epimerase/dehydratase family protein, partial [Deltaproteobacteria bacterium]|nr:NAD-dependent epimerase/dehydratase family protein [Deltaproteobacteria bacterium]
MIQGQNILVAGGTGLVGSNLALKLKEMGAHVRASYFSRKPAFLESDFQKFDFTELDQCIEATKDMQYVFICAAQTFGAK